MAQPDLRDGDGPVVLVLSPTRELCKQVAQEAIKFGGSCGINAAAVYGGADKSRQEGITKTYMKYERYSIIFQ